MINKLRLRGKYLLYIDILGFSDLVLKRGQVRQLYEIINSLHAHEHPNFKTLAFSDTILIYNSYDPDNESDRRYLVMFLCEFAQDLFYRLIGKDLHFRAYLALGEFNHEVLKNIQAFYGETLVRTYRRQSEIQCSGLFVENDIAGDFDVFHADPYDSDCRFVHLMQSLDRVSFAGAEYPVPADLILPEGQEWFLAYDFTYLRNIYSHMNDINLPPRVRVKYGSAWQMIRKRHKVLLDVLEASNFNPRSISDFDWSEPMRRVGTSDGFHG
jgi:hypothetical protein